MTGLWVAFAVAAVPEGRDLPGQVMPDRMWDFEHLALDVRLDLDASSIAGTATWNARRLDATAGAVQFHQVGLDITAVTVDGEPVEDFRVAGEWLRVPVPGDRDTVQVAITYRAVPQSGLHYRGGKGAPADEVREVWSQGEDEENRHWYPGWDYPNDKFTVHTTIEAEPGLVALGNGVLADVETLDTGWKRWTYELDRPIVNYLVAITVGDYEVYTEEARVPLEYVVHAGEGEQAARRSLDRVAQQLPFFEALLGEPYPYDIYRQVMVQRFMYGGMENATLTTLNDGRVLRTDLDPPGRTDSVVAHELAHQWFGDLLTCYGWRELWLNEGFATFYAARWQEHTLGPEHAAWLLRRWHRSARGITEPMAARAHSKKNDRDNAGVYVKGASVLHMLRVHLGDTAFDAAIRAYVAQNVDRLVESEDLRRVLEEQSGQHLGWLFDQWVTGTGVATLEASHQTQGGQLEITLRQTQEGPAFIAPVRVEIGLPDRSIERLLWVGEGTSRLTVDVAEEPLFVAVDPSGGVLARWTRDQTTTEWIHQARHSTHPFARLEAISQLTDVELTEDVLTLLTGLLSERSGPVRYRVAAAEALGASLDPSALDSLVAALDDDDATVREAVAEALEELSDSRSVPDLKRAVRSDSAPHVRSAALRALAEIEPETGLTFARTWLARPDPTANGRLHRAACDVLGDNGDEGEIGLLIPKIRERTPPTLLHAAAKAAVTLAEDLDDDAPIRTRLARSLDPLLKSASIDTVEVAVWLLSQVGDETSEHALRTLAKATRLDGLAEDARAAARRIRSRDAEADEAPEDEDLEALEDRLEALEERIGELEIWR